MSDLPSSYILGIAEKPTAAKRIAKGLSEKGSITTHKLSNVSVYEFEKDGKTFLIAPAIGHIFTLSMIGHSWNYPALDFEWVPSYFFEEKERTRAFIDVFSILASGASSVIIMTDYDREGEVIGYLILHYLLWQTTAERMKFSTLTKRDLLKSYDNRALKLDLGLLDAGLLRHYVDFLYGINYTRALTLALLQSSGRFQTISIGRVQGPTLSFVVERENQIETFIPVPYWVIDSEVLINGKNYTAYYEKEKIANRSSANNIVESCINEKLTFVSYNEEEKKIFPFAPFNLSELQKECFRFFNYSPTKTLETAEKLYLKALISYPRTDSQKLPMTLGHKSIIQKLGKIATYTDFSNTILKAKKFKPFEGKKTDPAHPAIHPTGNKIDNSVSVEEQKIYDLIARRYLSTFGSPAIQLMKSLSFTIKEHNFFVNGSVLLFEGWIEFYKPYFQTKDYDIPKISADSEVSFSNLELKEKFTSAPVRFNESSLLQEMEKEKIGTKATRANIISTLFKRGYIDGYEIKPTELGRTVVDVLKEHYPLLIRTQMTSNLETKLDSLEQGKKALNPELLNIKKELLQNLIEFQQKENEIGLALFENIGKKTIEPPQIIGNCVECKNGQLRIITSRKTRKKFIACTNYDKSQIKCSATYPLPTYKRKLIETDQICPFDKLPLLEIVSGKEKTLVCISPDCQSKKGENQNAEEK